MEKIQIKLEVATKVNKYLDDKYIHIDGEYPNEEYGVNVVTKAILREALDMAFEETYKLINLQNYERTSCKIHYR